MVDLLKTRKGQITTFYSYKGGTGRSMAVANVAWILASNGKKVLAVDWDLEAPGLHEYFRPFLDEDPDLESTDGLIDMMVSFAGEAMQLHHPPEDLAWYEEHANLLRYVTPIRWKFPINGKLDFLSAGRQNAAYATRVNRFDWIGFYERLGGQRFMSGFRDTVRREYDYVLIDSRTGVSDTAGICTVQLPDSLVVAFTLNRQGIRGAAAVTSSIGSRRLISDIDRTIRIFPVPMRLDNAEKQALDDSVSEVRARFGAMLSHLPQTEQDEYWRKISVPYIPFYAYGELLAPLADQPSVSLSLIGPMSAIAQHITNGAITGMPELSESERESIRLQYRERLRKAKLPAADLFQERESIATDKKMPELFLSYSHEDAEMVDSFVRRLSEKHLQTFLAPRDLSPGEDWSQTIESAIRRASAACVFIGTSEMGPWHRKELLALLERASTEGENAESFRLIPVLLPGARPSEMPTGLSAYQWIDIRERTSWPKAAEDIARVVLWGKLESGTDYDASVPARVPYPGLRPFTELDSSVFFGRESLVKRVLDELISKRIAILVGPSGSGKSSLIRAGIIPKLAVGEPGRKRIEPIALRPGQNPFNNLAQALASTERFEKSVEIGSGEFNRASAFHLLVSFIESAPAEIVIIVDQLEELLFPADSAKTAEFLGLLNDIVASGLCRVLISLRSDYVPFFRQQLAFYAPALLATELILLDELTLSEIAQAIRAPAEIAGRIFEDGLVERIGAEFTDAYSLPLLQAFLSALWENSRGKVITHRDYQEMGGIAGFFGHAVDRVLSGLTPRTRALALRVLTRLVSTAQTKLTVGLSEFADDEKDAIAQLTVQGILRQTEIDGTQWVSLSHDALVRGSRILQTQLKEAEEFLAWKSHFAGYFYDWENLGHTPDFLLRGVRLQEAGQYLSSPYSEHFSQAEGEYVRESKLFELHEKRRRIQNRVVLVGLLLFSLLMVVLLFLR